MNTRFDFLKTSKVNLTALNVSICYPLHCPTPAIQLCINLDMKVYLVVKMAVELFLINFSSFFSLILVLPQVLAEWTGEGSFSRSFPELVTEMKNVCLRIG